MFKTGFDFKQNTVALYGFGCFYYMFVETY